MTSDVKDLTKELLVWLLIGGGISLALTNPAFLVPAIFLARYPSSKASKIRLGRSVNYLKHKGYISVVNKNGRTNVRLTRKGKDRAGTYLLESRLAEKSRETKKWDKVWRLVVFDIEAKRRNKRDALRRLLRRTGFEQLQKSVWIYPYDCEKEIEEAKDFFGIADQECRVVISRSIGDDRELKKKFDLR